MLYRHTSYAKLGCFAIQSDVTKHPCHACGQLCMMIVSLGVHTFMHEMYRGLSSFNCSQICIRVGWNFDLCSIFVVLALQFLGGCPCVNCVNVNIEEIWNKILFKWLRNNGLGTRHMLGLTLSGKCYCQFWLQLYFDPHINRNQSLVDII